MKHNDGCVRQSNYIHSQSTDGDALPENIMRLLSYYASNILMTTSLVRVLR